MYNKKVKSLIAKTVLSTALGITTGFVAITTTGSSAFAAAAASAKHPAAKMHSSAAKHAMPTKEAMSHSAHRDVLFTAEKFNSANIEKALHGAPGIIEMNANSTNKHVWAQYNPSKTSPEKIGAALKKAGVKPEAIHMSSPSKMKTHRMMENHTAMKKNGAIQKTSTMKKNTATPMRKMGATMTTKKATTQKRTTSTR